MKICHVVVNINDDLNGLHGVIIKQYFFPGGEIGKSLSSINYSFTIDGKGTGSLGIEFRSETGRMEETAYLASDVDARFRIGFYGIRPR